MEVGWLGLVGWGSKRHNVRDSHSGERVEDDAQGVGGGILLKAAN